MNMALVADMALNLQHSLTHSQAMSGKEFSYSGFHLYIHLLVLSDFLTQNDLVYRLSPK